MMQPRKYFLNTRILWKAFRKVSDKWDNEAREHEGAGGASGVSSSVSRRQNIVQYPQQSQVLMLDHGARRNSITGILVYQVPVQTRPFALLCRNYWVIV